MKSIGTTLNLCFVNLSFVLLSCTVKYNIRTLSVKIKRKEIIEGDNTIVAPLVKQNIGCEGDNTIILWWDKMRDVEKTIVLSTGPSFVTEHINNCPSDYRWCNTKQLHTLRYTNTISRDLSASDRIFLNKVSLEKNIGR